ncbi:peptide ligase PGM1-related protein [Streptomyces sp. NPDC044780]|uniref:preATP grasp domain-containing protein n=1 Tax=unclassified Streptomyces TaxID=2593676 RepID=UPI0033DAE3CD
MPRIIVLNIGGMSSRQVYRQLWMAEAGDIVVSPVAIDAGFLAYVHDVLGLARNAVTVVVADGVLTDEAMCSPGLVAELRSRMAASPAWELMPAALTEGVTALAELLGIEADHGLRFAGQRGPELLNRKSHFRQLAVGAGLPVPSGAVVTSVRALATAIERHLPPTGTVIVKRDDDLNGQGNLALIAGDSPPLPGVREVRPVTDDIPALAAQVWSELADEEKVLVVESYHQAALCFYFEYLIDADGFPRYLASGTIRRRPDTEPTRPDLVWVGLELPAELPPDLAYHASTEAARIAGLAAQVGYRGHINVDALVTEAGELLFNEVNARWGGGLALHTIGERLLGTGYADRSVVSSLRDVTPMRFPDFEKALHLHDLHFQPEAREGVVVVSYDEQLASTSECVVIAASKARARAIEARLRQVVGELAEPPAGPVRVG